MLKNIEKIASDILDIKTLETQNSDALDFAELAVWQIKAALIAAYQAGKGAK